MPAALAFALLNPGAAHAAGASITNGGSRTFSICHNAQSESECASGVGSLSAGQNSRSKYGWEDTDMIFISGGCELQYYTVVPPTYQPAWRPWASAGSGGRWFKVRDPQGGSYRVIC